VSRAWVQELCGGPGRARVATPFRATVDGEDWDCATTMWVLVMLRGPARFEARTDAPPVDQIVESPRKDPVDVSLEELLEWSYSSETEDECENCEAPLHACAPGYLCGARLNRRLLWESLVLLPRFERVTVSAGADERDPLMVESPQWRLFVMPCLRVSDGEPPESDFPRFP
jgi:hypothetical protein